jgi:hypothetical protein
LAITAPTMPPISACEELLGMPYHQVIRFQVIAPTSAPNTTCVSTTPGSTMPLPTVAATLRWKTKIATIEEGREQHRLRGLEHAGGDHGGDRVRRVVEAVHEVEQPGPAATSRSRPTGRPAPVP